METTNEIKTWKDFANRYGAEPEIHLNPYSSYTGNIEKGAIALLRLYDVISTGYGGWVDQKYVDEHDHVVCVYLNTNKGYNDIRISHIFKDELLNARIAFVNSDYANEFLSHPENVELIKDYYLR